MARRWSVPDEKVRTWVSHYRLHGIDGLRPPALRVRAGVAQCLQIGEYLLDGAPLFARSASFNLEPAGKFQCEDRAWQGQPDWRCAVWRRLRAGTCGWHCAIGPGDFSDGQQLSQGPKPMDREIQYCHVYQSWSPAAQLSSVLALVRGSGLNVNHIKPSKPRLHSGAKIVRVLIYSAPPSPEGSAPLRKTPGLTCSTKLTIPRCFCKSYLVTSKLNPRSTRCC